MNSYANRITLEDNCGADYRLANPLVIQAFIGLSSYVPMHKAGCLKDHDGGYCFAKAMTNSTESRMDSWPYFVPLGTALPVRTETSCSSCVQRTMKAFADTGGFYAPQYARAAGQINTHCGANFVPVKTINSGASRLGTASILISLVAFLLHIFAIR